MSQGQPPPPGGYGPPAGGGGGGYGAPPGGGYGGPPGGGGYGAPPGGGGYGPPGGPGAYTPPGWSAPLAGFAPMPANLPPGYIPDGGTIPLEGGVPWERTDGNFFSRWWDTMKACNSETRPFFAAAAQNEKGDAITFAMISGAVSGAAIGLLYFVMMAAASAGLTMAFSGGGRGSAGGGAIGQALAAGLGLGLFYMVLWIMFSAVIAVVRPFILGGLHHVLLMMFGGIGERKSFMHTVRVMAYSEGAAMPWIWIPIAGPFVVLFFGIKNIVIGYDETHRCGIGRALIVLSFPFLCCCGCASLMVALGALPAIL